MSVPSHDDGALAGDRRHPPLSDDNPSADDDDYLVRPYTVTGGRTEPRYQLEIEAMVIVTYYEARDIPLLSPECQAILDFCREWRSVAEVSAVLQMPLGVARILIADLAVDGRVRIQQLNHSQGPMDVKLLERVLSGLRRLLGLRRGCGSVRHVICSRRAAALVPLQPSQGNPGWPGRS